MRCLANPPHHKQSPIHPPPPPPSQSFSMKCWQVTWSCGLVTAHAVICYAYTTLGAQAKVHGELAVRQPTQHRGALITKSPCAVKPRDNQPPTYTQCQHIGGGRVTQHYKRERVGHSRVRVTHTSSSSGNSVKCAHAQHACTTL